MKKYQTILLILLITGINSCNKNTDEEILEYPTKYTINYVTEPVVKIFTKGGEITPDDKIINRFRSSLPSNEEIKTTWQLTAIYTSADSIKLEINDVAEEKTRTVHYQDKLIYWESQDTIKMPIFNSMNVYFKYSHLYYEEFSLPWTSGYKKVILYKHCFFVNEDDGKIELPMLDCVARTYENGFFTGLGINNKFNEKSVLNFSLNDTIAVWEYSIMLKENIDYN